MGEYEWLTSFVHHQHSARCEIYPCRLAHNFGIGSGFIVIRDSRCNKNPSYRVALFDFCVFSFTLQAFRERKMKHAFFLLLFSCNGSIYSGDCVSSLYRANVYSNSNTTQVVEEKQQRHTETDGNNIYACGVFCSVIKWSTRKYGDYFLIIIRNAALHI